MKSQPPAPRNILIQITPTPANNINKLTVPSKSVRSVIPLGREPFCGDEGADEATGAEEAEGVIGVPHEGQKLLFSSKTLYHILHSMTLFHLDLVQCIL